ncbi:MAG: hypothetical protein V1831_02420 [Candidatus Woesearchaeota archaeon]
MELHMSRGTMKVDGIHFYGPNSHGAPSDWSSYGAKEAMYSKFPINIGFDNKPSIAADWFELMKFSYNPHPVIYGEGKKGFVVSTANNKVLVDAKDMEKYGAIYNQDESMFNMDNWKAAGELCHTIRYEIKPTGKSGFYEGEEYVPDYSKFGMTNINVPIHRWSGKNMDINKVGIASSQIQNLWQDHRDVIYNPVRSSYNPETEAYLNKLFSKRFMSPGKIDVLGVEDMSAVAATYNHNGDSTLVASIDIYQKASDIAKKYGLTGNKAVQLAKKAIWYHELYHVADRNKLLTRSMKEVNVGEFLAELFSERAGIADGNSAYNAALARYNKNYAKGWRKFGLNSIIGNLVRQYALEARERGMSDAEAREYAKNKLGEEFEELDASELEEIVENEEVSKEEQLEAIENKKEYSKKEMNEEDSQEEPDEEKSNEAEEPADNASSDEC